MRSFESQILSVWNSIPKRAVGFRPNAFLYSQCTLHILLELEAQRLAEEEERRRLEEIMLARMAEEERIEYERKKKEEEERRLREAEEQRYVQINLFSYVTSGS